MKKKELDELIEAANEAHSKVTDFLIKVNTIYRKYYNAELIKPELPGKDTASISLDSEKCTEMSFDDHFDGESKDDRDN